MNQVLKRKVYQRGTVKQVRFLAELGEMTQEETTMLLDLHDRKDDQYIQDHIGVNRSSFEWIQESMSSKLLMAILLCINYTKDNMEL